MSCSLRLVRDYDFAGAEAQSCAWASPEQIFTAVKSCCVSVIFDSYDISQPINGM